jgi:hypothetical protein
MPNEIESVEQSKFNLRKEDFIFLFAFVLIVFAVIYLIYKIFF